ncbi:MAG: zf-HC2 domain-containing protein [Gemmatimonadaceae bacterium]
MTTHIEWDTLNNLLDGQLSPDSAQAARDHIAACEACMRSWKAVQALSSAARALPESVEPPDLAWREIRTTIDSRKGLNLPGNSARQPGLVVGRRTLAAAAVLLIAATATTTALWMRRPSRGPIVSAVDSGSTMSAAHVSDVAALEGEYVSTASALRATLEQERDRLSPETIKTVEASLAVIDQAIAEAREALLRDPSNEALRDVLRNNHRQRVDFLRRATALVERT